ncbi:MFS transporter [Burkholderia sp. WAC0059]|uniref:MFS transporter n=1 Tax=Burkholderia sp. WAC0059 TaxID=2066022 RepID=UPI000C7E9B41|nr:MFS transporter [Burkholderia sp. WAC0059]PLZ00317.1 MFS transporter [Burkholderia sp. WAC0059]
MQQISEKRVVRKIFWRVVPLLMALYVISFVDRINVGFAALTMNHDIGLTPYLFGWGAGIFFFGYFIFEIPSNVMMAKVGARRWIARILLSWGLFACAMALVRGPASFVALRFLLGVAEAGFFPGVILYLTYWFPARYRARIVAAFMLSIPVSIALGAPISTLILQMNGLLGLKGWQWLFVIEGLPAIAGAGLALTLLTDRPEEARWLTQGERAWLAQALADDAAQAATTGTVSGIGQALVSPIVLVLAFIYLCATGSNLGLSFFLPQIIKQQGYDNIEVGLLTAIPYLAGCAGMLAIGQLSDRFGERRGFLAATMAIAAAGLIGAGMIGTSAWSIAALSLAAVGIFGCKGPFWSLPASYLRGPAIAGGIAFINAIGNLGGFVGPFLVGLFKRASDSYADGLYALAGMCIAGLLATILFVRTNREPSPAGTSAAAGELAVEGPK